MKFSRFLYSIDEVVYSFIDCMLTKRSLKESFFWISEYYYSGFKTWNIIWLLYYDFYAVLNPTLEKIIITYQKKKNIEAILFITKNLFCLKHNTQVFKLRIAPNNCLNQVYNSKIPKWAKKNPNLLLSIHYNHTQNISFYMNRYIKNEQKLYNLIHEYFTQIKKMKLNYPIKLKKLPYKNKIHICMAIFCHLQLPKDFIQMKSQLTQPTLEEINFILSLQQPIKPLYKTLRYKRLFSISQNIGCFPLKRYKFKHIAPLFWYHWIYYAYKSPIWKKRIDKYNVIIMDEKKLIVFEDEEEEEDFMETFNYEPDEQSKETQMKSICDIQKCDISLWLSKIERIKHNSIQSNNA